MRQWTLSLIPPLAAVWLATGASAGEDAARRDFEEVVKPFLSRHCVACHGAELSENDLRLDMIVPADKENGTFESWHAALEHLVAGTMPPEGEPRPPREDVENVIDWIRQSFHTGPAADLLELPGFGNYVDHESLFTEPKVRKAASPARLWRISPHIFASLFNTLAGRPVLQATRQGNSGLHPALPFVTPPHSFRDQSLVHAFEDTTTSLVVGAAWEMAGYQVEGPPPLVKKNKPVTNEPARAPRIDEPFARCVAAARPTDEDYRAAIEHQFQIVLQRPPTAEESDALVSLARRTEPDAGAKAALHAVLAAVLLTPEALFRFEVGAGEADKHGRVRLAPREIAYAISYAITDRPPDEALLAAAEAGRLDTQEGVAREAARIMNDASIDKPRLPRFFQEYFEYRRASEVFKDVPPDDPNFKSQADHQADVLVNDADQFVLAILAEDRDVLRRLLTQPAMFVNWRDGRKVLQRNAKRMSNVAGEYDLPRDWEWTANQPIDRSPTRAGILTHPAWLLAFSDNEKNQAIQRGLWIRTKLLGGTVPDVPIGVDARLPNDPALTLREKMRVTREEYCWKCHQRMDPLGLPFEQFDYYGRHRERELERPVDTTGWIDIGDAELDGEVTDPYEYVERLAASRRVEQVFTRHAFRYWLGRNETLDDAPTLIDAHRAYVESDGSMRALVVSLLSSDSFLYRRSNVAEPLAAARRRDSTQTSDSP